MRRHPVDRPDRSAAPTRHRVARLVATACVVVGLAAGALGLTQLVGSDGGVGERPPPAAPSSTPAQVVVDPPGVVPTPAAEVAQVPAPTRVEVPAIGVDEPLTGAGLRADGSMDVPDFGRAGWYTPGPRPGEAGGAVVVAHVHGPGGPDVFWDLATLRPGDVIRVHRPGAVARFVVDAVEDVAKEALPHDRIWPSTDSALLRLITCGGTRDPERGYPDNTIVYAHLVATTPAR